MILSYLHVNLLQVGPKIAGLVIASEIRSVSVVQEGNALWR
jgi:hypothetical protein